MPRTNQNVWLGCAGVAALAVTGCQTAQPHTALGALPGEPEPSAAAQPDKTPTINAATYFAHAHLLERQGAFDRALEQYRKVLELQPDFIGVRNRMGITLNKVGKNADATTQFRLALQKQPNSAYLHNNLGFSLFLEKKYAEALTEFEAALALKGDFSRARMNYGVTLGKLGSFDKAFEQFSKVCAPQDAYFNLGMLETEAGEYGPAAKAYEQALAINPKFDAARAELSEVARLAAEVDAQMKAIADAKTAAQAAQAAAIAAQPPTARPDGSVDVTLAGNDEPAMAPRDVAVPAPQPMPAPAELDPAIAPTPTAVPISGDAVLEDSVGPALPDCDDAPPRGAIPAVEAADAAPIDAPPIDAPPVDAAPVDAAPADAVQVDAVQVEAAAVAGAPASGDTDSVPDDAVIQDGPDAPKAEPTAMDSVSNFEVQAIDLAPFGESTNPFDMYGTAQLAAVEPWSDPLGFGLAGPFGGMTFLLQAPPAQPAALRSEPMTASATECDEAGANDPDLTRAERMAGLIEQMLASAGRNIGQVDALLSRLEGLLSSATTPDTKPKQ